MRHDDFVARRVSDVADALRQTAWDRSGWEETCARFAQTLAGSALCIVNFDPVRQAVNEAVDHGIDPEYMESYRNHYAALNPWSDFCEAFPSGVVSASEEDYPARAFRHTEFYNDWLAPQGNMTAAVGLRLAVDPHNEINISWHYDVAKADEYDAAATAILEKLKPRLVDTVRASAMLRDGLEARLRIGALIERIDGAALLVERGRQIREANAVAEAALRDGKVLSGAGNVLALRDQGAQRWLEEVVTRLADGETPASPAMTFSLDDRVFSVSVTAAPDHADPGFPLLVRPRPMVLVVVKLLVGGTIDIDRESLRIAYGLSAAEIRLCEVLLNGHSLAEAARMLDLTEGTVRQRVKMIFQKTGTHRQGELVALLVRFGAAGW